RPAGRPRVPRRVPGRPVPPRQRRPGPVAPLPPPCGGGRRVRQPGPFRASNRARMMVPLMVDGEATAQIALDAAHFTVLLEAALDPAHRLATVMLRDRPAAEDAVQEAALKAWRKH